MLHNESLPSSAGQKSQMCPAGDAPLNVTGLAIRSFGDLHEIDRVVVLAYQFF